MGILDGFVRKRRNKHLALEYDQIFDYVRINGSKYVSLKPVAIEIMIKYLGYRITPNNFIESPTGMVGVITNQHLTPEGQNACCIALEEWNYIKHKIDKRIRVGR